MTGPTTLRDALVRAEAAGRSHVILVTVRSREPKRRISLAPGLSADVVGTERTPEGQWKIVFSLAAADVHRWIDRALATVEGDGRGPRAGT